MREYSKGQTLIEVLVALAVAIVIISAVSSAVVSSLSNTQFSKDQGLANRYAQEGMEHVRKIRNQSWSGFAATVVPSVTPAAGNPFKNAKILCLDKNLQLSSPIAGDLRCAQNVGSFIRTVKVESNSCACKSDKPKKINIRKVTVSVAWSDSKCVSKTPTPTPRACREGGIACSANGECCSRSCSGRGTCTYRIGGLGDIPTPTPTTCDEETTAALENPAFCHKTELVTCMSDVSNIPTQHP